MYILLTGASGFLGRLFLKNLTIDFNVKTLSKSAGDYIVTLDQCIPAFNETYNIVVHLAGLAHSITNNPVENELFHKVNVIGTQNLLEGLNKSGVPKSFVFISSVSVYGLDSGTGFDEYSNLKAIDPYGKSKIEAERIICNWCKQHNVVCTILRLPLVVGNNPSGNLGAMIKGIKKGYYFNIGGGTAKKSMVLAEDVAKIITEVAKIGGIYNLTDGYHPTFAEISNTISIQLGKEKPMNIPFWLANIMAKFGDLLGGKAPLNRNKLKKITSDLTFDDSKAREAFGWNPAPVLEGFKINLL
jgi:nucleoside-diphosphate-sugar epimerase